MEIDTPAADSWDEEEEFLRLPAEVPVEQKPPIPEVSISDTSAQQIQDDWDWGSNVPVLRSPNKSGAGMKRLSDRPIDQEEIDNQPAGKCACVDDDAAPHIIDQDGYYIRDDDNNMDTGVDDDNNMDTGVLENTEQESLLTVPTFERTPVGSPKKTAVRRFSNSPGTSQFTGNNFELSPRKPEF